jgi:DNA polymerase-3 subunit delta
MAKTDSLELFNRLETSVSNGVLKPVYFLCGKETLLINKSQRLIIEHALESHERDFNLTILYGGDTESKAVLAECASYPTMAQRRVVVIREFEELSENDRFMSYASKPNPSTVLVIVSGAGLNTNPYAAISRASETFNFQSVQDRRLPGWIAETMREQGYKISGEAAEMLRHFAGTDLQTLSNEVDKLISYAGDRTTITPDDVLKVAGQSSEFNVFELQKRVAARDFIGSERILDRMLQVSSNTTSTAMITVTVLASYFTKLLKLSGCHNDKRQLTDAEIAKAIGAPVYFLREYKSALGKLGEQGIDRALLTLTGADFELKGGTEREERLILTMMLRRLTEGRKRNIGRATA